MNNRLQASSVEDQIIAEALDILRERTSRVTNFLSNQGVAKDFLVAKLALLQHEVFGLIYLNSKLGVIDTEDIFRGTLNSTDVYPREIIKAALNKNAAAVVIYHNHPGGSMEPSPADITITKKLAEAFKLVDVRLVDHIIVCGAKTYAFSENGKLPSV
jgi:DNA repair protein RadC